MDHYKKGNDMNSYSYIKGAKKGIPASVGAAAAVVLGKKLGLDETSSILIGGWVSNFVYDWFKRVVVKKYLGHK